MNDIDRYYKESLLANLCGEYKGEWKRAHSDKEKLVRLCLRQQAIPHVATFAYNGKGLTKEFVAKEFADYINGYTVHDADGVKGYTYGLYVDWDYENDIDVNVDVCSVMWTVGANIVIKETKCPVLYVSNRSNVHLVCEGYNSVNVKLFDKSRVTIEDLDENSTVVVYKYSDDASVELGKYCFGKVKIFNKTLRL